MDYSELSGQELIMAQQNIQKEIERRREKEIEVKRKQIKAKLDIIQNNPQLLDLISHDRTSCIEENPSYNGYDSGRGYARCAKCHLLEVLRDHENGIHDFDVTFAVNISLIGNNV